DSEEESENADVGVEEMVGDGLLEDLLGVEGAEALLAELLDFAGESLGGFGPKADPLRALAEVVRGKARL
ncbi:MAG: hypothetical protein AAF725_26135, partial [Acidobacteriota bacterium]